MGCEVCGSNHAIETCSLLGHFFPVSDRPTISYARLSLPDGLMVRDLINDNKTVIATKIFLRGVQFGPFKAPCTPTLHPSIFFPLKIFLKNGDHVFLKTDDEQFNNWMCFVATATSFEEINMYCYQRDEEIYFSVTKDLLPGSELKVWYSPHYAKIMNVDPLPSDSCLAEPDVLIVEVDTKAIEDHQYINKKKKRKKKWKPTDGDINWQLPERMKGKLPAEMLGAVKPVNEWKCYICNVIEPNVACYARHLIHHFTILCRVKCSYCNIIKRTGKHERTCKLFLFKQGLSDGSDLNEEDRRKANRLPKAQDLMNNNALSDVTNNLNRVKTADDIQLSEPLIVKVTTSLIDTNKPTDNLLMNCDKDNDIVNYQFEIMNNNKNNLNIQVSDFFGKAIWNNDSGVSIDNVIDSNNLVPLTDSNLSLKERQLDLNPPILDLSDEIEFQSLKNFSDTIDSNLEKQFSICRNVECPDLFDNVAVSNLLSGVDNMSTTLEQFPIFSLDKSEFLQQKFDTSLEVTDEDKNRLVENLLKESDDRMNVSVYDVTDGDELKDDDDGELVTQDHSKVQEESFKKKGNEASEVFACDICTKSFRKLEYLIRHLRKHTGDFSCKFCLNIFARKETLLTHTCLSETNAEYRKDRCGICNVVLYSAMELSSHIAYHYCTYSKWECKHCRLVSDDVERLDEHFCLQSNGLKRQFSCDNCYKLFSTSTEFKEHREEVNIKKSKLVKEKKTICEVCGIVLAKKAFTLHRLIHNAKRFECKECGRKFARQDTLKIHRLKHSLPKFSCTVCEKKFNYKRYLKEHLLSHTKNLVRKFSCEHCNKRFFQKYHMLVHVRNHFGIFKCDVCRKTFTSKISLKRHSITHTRETTFRCTLCDRRFLKEKQMLSHRRTFHSRDYTCHYCNTHIGYRQSLKRHLTSRHLDSKHEWDVEGALDSMKTTLIYTDVEQMEEENFKSSDEQMQEENFEPSDEQMQEENFEPQATEIVDRDGLPDLVNDVSTIQVADSQNLVTLSKERVLDLMNSTSNISVTDSQDLIAMSKEKLLDLVIGTSNIAVTDSQDLIAMSKERLFDLVNDTSNIPATDSEDLIALSKERLLELLNGTSDVNTSQDLIELSKEGLLDLANGATDIPVTTAQELVGLNVDNITVNVLWTNVENEQMAESETLNTKNDAIVPMVQLTAPEEFTGLNVDNSCIDNGIGTYILEDGRIMNEDVQLGGDIFFYVVEPTTDEQELLFV